MTTAGDLVDRVYREYLHPGDEQPARTTLTAAVDSSATAWTVDLGWFAADEVDALAAGVIVEAGLEQALIVDRSGDSLTVRRGMNGTVATSHDSGRVVTVAPTFGRRTVFEAVSASIVALWPQLWWTRTTNVTVAQPLTPLPADFGAADLFRPDSTTVVERYAYSVVEDPDVVSGKSALIPVPAGTTGNLTYRARFTPPASEVVDVTADHGVRVEWERVVLVGAVAEVLFGTPELDPVTAQYVTAQLETEVYPPRTSGQIARALWQWREVLMERAAAGLRQEGPAQQVVFHRPIGGVLI